MLLPLIRKTRNKYDINKSHNNMIGSNDNTNTNTNTNKINKSQTI
jgi:hypothetical protein